MVQRGAVTKPFNFRSVLSFSILLLSLTILPVASAQELNLLPQPKKVERGSGQVSLRDGILVNFTGVRDQRVDRAVPRFYDRLAKKLGFVIMQQAGDTPSPLNLEIACEEKGKKIQSWEEDESYTLTVSSSNITLKAKQPLGVLRGLETLIQLAYNTDDGYGALPVVTIDDAPRFAWRGLLFDVSRHYIPLEQIRREIDGMAAVKMNILHLHLSDDQSFRVESKKYPDLTKKSSHGKFYTQAEIKDLIAYARDRGVRIVPEFDVPGHSTAWLATFPELAVKPDDLGAPFIRFGGYINTLDPSNPKLLKVLDRLFGEMADLFPDEYFHIGGDEVNYKYWKESPSIQEFKKKNKLADEEAVQAHFNTQLEKVLHKHGKKMVGWNEILHSNIPKTTVIHSWTGVEPLQEAVTRGYPVIASLGWYLDWFLPAWFHYNIDPLRPDPNSFEYIMQVTPGARQSKKMNEQKAAAEKFQAPANAEKFVLGGQAAEWTEIATPWTIDSVLWPRMAAIAERLWSPADVRDVASLYRRFDPLMLELSDIGITPAEDLRKLRVGLAGSFEGGEVLGRFAETVEPVKYYTRNQRQKRENTYNINSPFNRMVDAVAPESREAFRFQQAVERFAESKSSDDLRGVSTQVNRWNAALPEIAQLIKAKPRLAEVAPVVSSLRTTLRTAEDAIAYIQSGEQAPDWWLQGQKSALEASSANAGDLQVAILPAVKKLVELAASTPASSPSDSTRK